MTQPSSLKPMSDQDTALTIAYMNPGVSEAQASLVISLLRRNGWLSPADRPAHERQVRERASEEILAKAEPYTDALTGPRASFRRGMEAAARHILPALTPQEIADAIARGDAVFCNPPEETR